MSLCFRLGHLPLLDPDEGRNSEIAREMKVSGAWLVPTCDGITYLDKPAFYFKAVAVSLAALGDNETAARVPSAVFGVALVVMIFLFCRKVYGMRCGLLAVIVVATTPLYLALARIVIFDMALAFFVCGAVFAGYLGETSEGKAARRNWFVLGAASAGFGTLVKGPVGFIVPLLVLFIFNWIEGRRDAWKRLLAPLNLLAFFGVTLPWFVGLCLAHRDFLYYGLVEESFHRFTSAKAFKRTEPVYFYLLIVAGTFFPWSVLLPEAGIATWKERWAKHSADRLCVIWAVVVVLFFSVSRSKMPGYILSVVIAFGILVARVSDAALASAAGRPARLLVRATGAFAAVCLVVAIAALLGALDRMRVLATPMHIPPEDAERLTRQAIPMAIVLLGFSIFGFVALCQRSAALCWLCLALFVPLGIFTNVGALDVFYDAKSGRRIADQLSALPPHTELACLECFPNGLPFYLERRITLISRDGSELTSNYIIYSLKKESAWPQQIVPLEDLDAWLTSRKTAVTLIVCQKRRNELEKIASARNGTIYPLWPGYVIAQLPSPRGL